MPKIDVLTARITVHIPFDSTDLDSFNAAQRQVNDLREEAALVGRVDVTAKVNRVADWRPQPEPAKPPLPSAPTDWDGVKGGVPTERDEGDLAIPPALDRTGEATTAADAAE